MVEAGLLPGVLMRNANLRFVCRMQHLTVERNDTPFTSHYAKGQVIKVAIAHGEGNYEADAETIRRLEGIAALPSAILTREVLLAAAQIPTGQPTLSLDLFGKFPGSWSDAASGKSHRSAGRRD